MQIDGKKIAILITPSGSEDPEFANLKAAVGKAGGKLTVISLETGKAETVNNELDPASSYTIDKAIGDVSADQFDALIVPGGCVGADKLRSSKEVVAFVRNFISKNKPVAVICHAPLILVEAGMLEGRTLTSYPTVQTDIENAGGKWVDQEV